MVNELVARVIVAERTEAAERAATQRRLIGAGRTPVPTVRRWRWPGRTVWPIRGRPSGRRSLASLGTDQR